LLNGFFSYFCCLSSYFVLQPLRDDTAVILGTKTLPVLFVASLLVTMAVSPTASAYIARSTKRRRWPLRTLTHRFYPFSLCPKVFPLSFCFALALSLQSQLLSWLLSVLTTPLVFVSPSLTPVFETVPAGSFHTSLLTFFTGEIGEPAGHTCLVRPFSCLQSESSLPAVSFLPFSSLIFLC